MASSSEQSEAVAVATTARGSCWSVTINNPTEEDRKALENFPSFVKKVELQEEVGKQGTWHIQAAVLTAQVRPAAIKKWLPRAHIEIARNKQALLNYVRKEETAIPGTHVVIQADYLSMDSALKAIAAHQMDYLEWVQGPGRGNSKERAFEKYEFWNAVKKILLENPKAVGLFTNPQLERAWVNTRSVWIALLEKDRQTDRQSALEPLEDISGNSIYDGQESTPGEAC